MLTAFVMIKSEPARIAEIAQTIADLPNVAEVYSVTGEFDIIALVRLKQYEELAKAVPEGIARVPGILSTKTILAFRQYTNSELQAGFDIGLS
ncbi:MAG: Lrp/AsnC ligand binding domain-containing protein [Chloroflexaceae bacterium]|jgi:DNA-binding Lrp family transcriptional regulator|nr:Lrp/AsnC ligand binding domain-containing protein [Chloroflexaceae bacterium]